MRCPRVVLRWNGTPEASRATAGLSELGEHVLV